MKNDQDFLEENKRTVRHFNLEVIERGNAEVAKQIFAAGFINHSAPVGVSNGPESMLNTFNNVLRPALAEMKVHILDQIAEGDRVTTRKQITGIHQGALMGIEPTQQRVEIDVIDIVRVKGGQYIEHWGANNLAQVLQKLKQYNQ